MNVNNSRYHDKKYPITVCVRLNKEQAEKLQKTEVSVSAIMRTLIDSL